MKYAQTVDTAKASTSSFAYLERILAPNWIWVGLLCLLGIVSRLPFQSTILYHWDSVNFAYAIGEFDLAKEQPHPPGYIGYVWLSRIVDSFVQDAQTTLTGISIVTGVLSVLALFYLGRAMFNRQTGVIAALLLLTSPLFWFYSEIALPHTLDTLLVIVTVWWLYETMRGDHGYLYPAVALLAVAGGVRQQTIIFLAPLLLFALRRVGWKRFILAGLLGGLVCLGWFIPLMVLSGGVSNYMRITAEFGARFQDTTSVFMGAGWWGLRRNIIKLTLYTLYGWGVAVVPAGLFIANQLRLKKWPQNWEKIIFLGLWVSPALIFYTLVHMGQQGLIFVFLPALLLFSAVGIVSLFEGHVYRLGIAVAVLLAVNTLIFCLGPEYPLGGTQRLLTRATLVNSDSYYRDRFQAIEANFAPGSTLILAANWHHVEYYLPEYERLPFTLGSKWEINEGAAETGSNVTLATTPADLGLEIGPIGSAIVVIFDPELMAFNHTPELTRELNLPNGETLNYFELKAQDRLQLEPDSFGVSLE